MRAYITHNMDNSEELHARLKSLGAKLAVARKTADEGTELLRNEENGREAVEVEAGQLVKERDVTEARHKKVDEENERLKYEMEELRVGFAAQNEELQGEYQKQVDDMFLFGYHCYMKKHGITQDTPNYPSDNEGEATGGFAREDGDVARIDPLNGQA